MAEITRALIARVGVDLAKQVIQVNAVHAVHAVEAAGRRVVARALKRDQFLDWCAQLPLGCLVAMEASSSAHHFARKLQAMGLDARLIAASFVSPTGWRARAARVLVDGVREKASAQPVDRCPVHAEELTRALCLRVRQGRLRQRP